MRRREPAKVNEAKQIGVKINPELWRNLRILALQMDRSATDVLEEAIAMFMRQHSEASVPKRRLSGRPVERG